MADFKYRVYDAGGELRFAWTGYAVFRITGIGPSEIVTSSPSLDALRLKAAAGGWESEVEPEVWTFDTGRRFKSMGWRPGPEVF